MRLICLDLSVACTGIAFGDTTTAPSFMSIKAEPKESIGRSIMRLHEYLEHLISTEIGEQCPGCVYAEAAINPGAFLGEYDAVAGKVKARSNPNTTIALAKMSAAAELTTLRAGVAYQEATVQSIRAAFLGSGRVKSHEAKRRAFELCKVIGWSPHNRDESDAGALFYYAATIVDPKHCALVTPMQQAKVAATIGGTIATDDEALLKRAGLR